MKTLVLITAIVLASINTLSCFPLDILLSTGSYISGEKLTVYSHGLEWYREFTGSTTYVEFSSYYKGHRLLQPFFMANYHWRYYFNAFSSYYPQNGTYGFSIIGGLSKAVEIGQTDITMLMGCGYDEEKLAYDKGGPLVFDYKSSDPEIVSGLNLAFPCFNKVKASLGYRFINKFSKTAIRESNYYTSFKIDKTQRRHLLNIGILYTFN